MSAKKCADCGAPFTPKPGNIRKYCHACSPPQRPRNKPPVKPTLVTVDSVPVEPGRIYAHTLATLQSAERHETPLGAVALTLAEQIDAGGHAATGYAALAKQLEATLASALDGVKLTVSAVDELRARRERRRA